MFFSLPLIPLVTMWVWKMSEAVTHNDESVIASIGDRYVAGQGQPVSLLNNLKTSQGL